VALNEAKTALSRAGAGSEIVNQGGAEEVKTLGVEILEIQLLEAAEKSVGETIKWLKHRLV
jgi:hypothetical protein